MNVQEHGLGGKKVWGGGRGEAGRRKEGVDEGGSLLRLGGPFNLSSKHNVFSLKEICQIIGPAELAGLICMYIQCDCENITISRTTF